MSANMSRRFLSVKDWMLWAVLLAASLACGAQAALRAWPEYEAAAADPGFRRQSPETLERIRRAATLEMGGQWKAAEHELRLAAASDRRFLSAWALANFYHRQDREADFWPWAQRAVATSYGDRTSLYALLLARGDAPKIREMLPPDLRQGLATYLISTGRLTEALAALADLDAKTARILSERLIAEGRFEEALTVWNRSQPETLCPEKPGLVNAEFREPPSGLGFDWRLGAGARIAAGRLVVAGPSTGTEFASQYVLLAPDRRYRLRIEHEAPVAARGLRWQIDDPAGRSNLLRDAPGVDVSREAQTLEFAAPPGARFARLALAARGPVRGIYAVRAVRLEFAD